MAEKLKEGSEGPLGRRYYTRDEVAKHNTEESVWIIIDKGVYDITEYRHVHPGGIKILKDCYGKDGTSCFGAISHTPKAAAELEKRQIGYIYDVVPKSTLQAIR